MKYSKFFKLLEKKDHIINKLAALTPEQKQEVIAFFTKHPNYENEIDWNRKDITWEDFEEIIYTERISGAQLKNFIKKDKHFLVLYSDSNCVLYQPLTWLSSRYLASTDVKPKVEGKWCISYQKERNYWDNYSFEKGDSFIILCTVTTKYALEISPEGTIIPWDAEDNKLKESDFYNEVSKEISNIENILQKYIPVAKDNHSLVEQFHKRDLEECAYIEKVKEEEREHRIKIFPKSFKRQVRKKGYYEWDGDISYDDLKNLVLIDEKGKVDEKFKYFKITGNLDFRRSPITSIAIPSSVTSIGDYAFMNCSSLTEITIPDSITSIGYSAFSNCSSLTEIAIPHSVTSIDSGGVFEGCSSLTSITIPDSVTSIGTYAFSECSSLKDIVIPDSVTSSIGYEAFYDCSSLKSVTIGKSVTSIDDYAFQNCLSLTKIAIPDSVTSIGENAFDSCESLTEITIPNSVTEIGEAAFQYCSSLISITIPNSVTSIENWTFYSCSSLTSVTILDGVSSIGALAFCGCSALTEINIPDSVTFIDHHAFAKCKSLTSITIPNNVTEIGKFAFKSCSSLKKIYIDREKGSLDLSKTDINKSAKIYWKGEF